MRLAVLGIGRMGHALAERLLAGGHAITVWNGAPAAVLSGEAIYIIGGPHELYERVRPAFEALADEDHRRYVGENPAVAATVKVLSNHLLLSGIAILAETVAAAQAAGLADDVAISVQHRGR